MINIYYKILMVIETDELISSIEQDDHDVDEYFHTRRAGEVP